MSPRNVTAQYHDGPVYAVSYLGTERTLLTGGSDGKVVCRSPGGGEQRVVDVSDVPISAICSFASSGLVAVGHEDGACRIIRLSDDDVVHELSFHTDLVSAILEIPGSDRALTTSYDGTIGIWDSDGWRCTKKLVDDALAPVTAAACPEDGSWFATSGVDSPIRIWETQEYDTERYLGDNGSTIVAIAVTGNGGELISLDYSGRMKFWDTDLWTVSESFDLQDSYTRPFDVHPTAEVVAVGGRTSVTIYDRKGDPVWVYDVGPPGVTSLAFSPDGEELAIGCDDGRVITASLDL